MALVRFLVVLAALLSGGLLAAPLAQSLSSQVLQLLTRTNTWTGQQTFQNLRLSLGSPSDTGNRLYNVGGVLYWNGAVVAGGGGGPTVHNLLSATHGDVTAATVVRGDTLVGLADATWGRLAVGTTGAFLRSDGTDVSWGTNGSALTALNASEITSGILPLGRLSGITNTQIAAGAGIAWTKLNTAGSSLADLTTRSASDLASGTLSDARLSANVSLFGAFVETGEITNGTILFADWSDNGCSSGQYPQWSGSAWACASITPGAGTVTSVGVSAPSILTVADSPVTGSGTISLSLATQTANRVFAGPSTGSAAAPTFRSLVYADLPTSAAAAGTYPRVTINAQGIVTGVATQIPLTTDVTGILPLANGGTGLNAAADDSVLLSTGTAWAAVAINNCTTGLTYATATNTFGCASATAGHNLLSASHSDTLAASVVRGDLIVGSSTPQWTRLALGAANGVLTSNGSDPSWSATPTLNGLTVSSGALTINPVGSLSAATPWAILGQLKQYYDPATATYYDTYDPGFFTTTPSVAGTYRSLWITTRGAEASSGTHPLMIGMDLRSAFANNGATTTAAATLRLTDAPTIGTSNYSLWVDDGTVRFDEGGYEYGRTVKQGVWAATTYAAGDYTASGSMTWTVDSGDVGANAYTIIGKTLYWTISVNSTTVVAPLSSELRVAIPSGVTINRACVGSFHYIDNGTAGTGYWQMLAATGYVTLRQNANAPNWTAATNATGIFATIVCEIQ